MRLFEKNIQPIITQSLVIGATRFVALSMPFADIVVLSKIAVDIYALSDYIFVTQIIQIFVVLSLSLSLGIVLFYNKINDKKYALQVSASYAWFLGIILLLLSLLLFLFLDNYLVLSESQYLTYIYLAMGILPLPAYIIFSNILDAIDKSNYTFNVTLIFAILNIILNIVFVLFLNAYNQVAVSLSTTIIRYFGVLVFFFLICREFKIKYFFPRINKKYFVEIASFGLFESISSLVFVISFAFLAYYLTFNFNKEITEQYGILLNFINIIFVIYAGFSSSLAIHLSKRNKEIPSARNSYWNRFIVLFCISIGFIVFLTIPIFSWLYFSNFYLFNMLLMTAALFVAIFDGISIAMISKLRVLDFKNHPPLFRLLLVLVGMPFGVILLNYIGIIGLFSAFALANLMIVYLLVFFDKKHMPKKI